MFYSYIVLALKDKHSPGILPSTPQFTRCVTSQLIKWFSNFREFYYIQMEKFARQAVVEGFANVEDITVGRHSELFRALNTHYNKANDFQVAHKYTSKY